MMETAHRTPHDLEGIEASSGAWRGIELCRDGDWQQGLYVLSHALQEAAAEPMPALAFAYLGYGLARYRSQPVRGIELCRRGIDLDFYRPEGYVFLAKTYLLTGNRRAAFESIERGLEIDPTDSALISLRRELGERRPPVVRALSRRHFVNRSLGKLRHRFRKTTG